MKMTLPGSRMIITLMVQCNEMLFFLFLQRDYFEPREPEIQSNHNHVTTSLDDHVDENTVVLSRTLSIGENCVNTNKWENNHACANSSVT